MFDIGLGLHGSNNLDIKKIKSEKKAKQSFAKARSKRKRK